MKHKGYDECSEYEYYDIINYKLCSICEYFYDNKKEQRFECLRDSEAELDCCSKEMVGRRQNNMSFFETLKKKADSFKIDITEEIDFLKTELESKCHMRHFKICLIKTTSTFAIGHGKSGTASFFVPEGVPPISYRNEFIKEFVKLGFDESAIKTNDTQFDAQTVFYNIELKW